MILIDTNNLYYGAKRAYDGKIDYELLIDALRKLDSGKIVAFVSMYDDAAYRFAAWLRACGYTVIQKEPRQQRIGSETARVANFNVEITTLALTTEDDIIVICSSSPDLLPLFQHLVNNVSLCILYATHVPYAIRQTGVAVKIIKEGLIKNADAVNT